VGKATFASNFVPESGGGSTGVCTVGEKQERGHDDVSVRN